MPRKKSATDLPDWPKLATPHLKPRPKPLDFNANNVRKAKKLLLQYAGYPKKAYGKKARDLREDDRDDLRAFINQRFWISCIRADPECCSRYLWQSCRFAALKYTSKMIKKYQLERTQTHLYAGEYNDHN
jgi:hypothetical protein